MRDTRLCPDCAVPPGTPHDPGCDVARCLETGHQRLSCQAEHDCGHDVWDGIWPGTAEAERYGVDLNTLVGSGRFSWDRTMRRWVSVTTARTLEVFTAWIPVATEEITLDDMHEIVPDMWRSAVEDAGGTPFSEPTVERVAPPVDHGGRSLFPGAVWVARAIGSATRG